jgi:two-component system invasion response regulator UvrY
MEIGSMTRILLADDHTIVREGLKQILGKTEDLQVCGEAASGSEVLDRVRSEEYDLIILDMSMPGRSGLDLIRQLQSEKPRLLVLILTMHAEEQYAVRAFRAGAAGYLTKDSASAELVSAVRKVAGGGRYVSPAVAERLAFDLGPGVAALSHTLLSDREFEVFRLIVAGESISAIANRLHLSVKTVSTHKTRILEKMQMKSAAELIRYAIKNQLADESGLPPADA